MVNTSVYISLGRRFAAKVLLLSGVERRGGLPPFPLAALHLF
jgi:hypothetical protein